MNSWRLNEVPEEEVNDTGTRLDNVSPSTAAFMQTPIQVVRETIKFAHAARVGCQILLMLANHHTHFEDGVLVDIEICFLIVVVMTCCMRIPPPLRLFRFPHRRHKFLVFDHQYVLYL
jgi:hypothetical protein